MDVQLICDNCKKYNSPPTIYYKAADKLQRFFDRLFAREAPKLGPWLPQPPPPNHGSARPIGRSHNLLPPCAHARSAA